MKLKDISLRKRLLFGNFLMASILIGLLLVMSWTIFAAVNFIGMGQRSAILSTIFPDKGAALSIQFAISSIKTTADKDSHLKLKKLKKIFPILEAQGITVAVLQGGKVVYSTPTANKDTIRSMILIAERRNESPSMLIWNDKGLIFRHTSTKHGAIILAAGELPFAEPVRDSEFPLETILAVVGVTLLIILVAVVIALAVYLSRLLSRQILEPLAKLREVAEKIREGNLDVALNVDAQDEVGETCRDFDRMRRELRANKILQLKYERNRKELIAGISHDLATPLTALKGYASGILEGIANTPQKKFHYVEMISKTVANMERLVESLFLFSKLDLGRIEFDLEKVSLTEYFSDFLADKKDSLAERGLILEVAANNKSRLVQIDRLQFSRFVDNILENSLKYRRGEVAHMRIDFHDEGNYLRVNFADNGRGVATNDLQKIFDSFYRTDPARSGVAKGSGLGLAIAKQIIIGMNGEIWAEATNGGGLTIVIRLPVVEEADSFEENLANRR